MFLFLDTTNQAKTKAKLLTTLVIFSASFLWFCPTTTKNDDSLPEQTTRRYQFDEDQKRLIPLTDTTNKPSDREQRKQKKIEITTTDYVTYHSVLSEIQENSELHNWIAKTSGNPAAITIHFQITSLQEIAKTESVNKKVMDLLIDHGFDKDRMLTTIELKTDISNNTIEITIFFSNNTLDSAFA